MAFLTTEGTEYLIGKLCDSKNIKITGNKHGNRVNTVIDNIVKKADDVTKSVEQEINNDSYTFRVGAGDVNVSSDVEDGFTDVSIKGVTYQNLIGKVDNVNSRWVDHGDKYHLDLPVGNGQPGIFYSLSQPLKRSTTYTFIVEIKDYTVGYPHFNLMTKDKRTAATTTEYSPSSSGIKVFTLTTKSDVDAGVMRIIPRSQHQNNYSISKRFIILEGDHKKSNLPISYFENIIGVGDKSKNLLNPKLHSGLINKGAYFISEKTYTMTTEVSYTLKPNTNYTLSFKKYGDSPCWFGYVINGEYNNSGNNALVKKTVTTDSTGIITLRFGLNSLFDRESKICDLQLRETSSLLNYEAYYDNYKVDIISCAGNLFDPMSKNIKQQNGYSSLTEIGPVITKIGEGEFYYKPQDAGFRSGIVFPIFLKTGDTIIATGQSKDIINIRLFKIENFLNPVFVFSNPYDEGDINVYTEIPNTTFTVNQSGWYAFRWWLKDPDRGGYLKNVKIQLLTSDGKYSEYTEEKMSILLDEPLMRLPNGTYDEITRDGKLIRRIGKIVLNGSTTPWEKGGYTNNYRQELYIKPENITPAARKRGVGNFSYNNFVCDRFPTMDGFIPSSNKWFAINGNGGITMALPFTELTEPYYEKAKEWISKNPITLYYELAEPVVTQLPESQMRIFKNGHLRFDTMVAPISSHTVQLNKSAQIERSVREVNSLDNKVSKLEALYDDLLLSTSVNIDLLGLDYNLEMGDE